MQYIRMSSYATVNMFIIYKYVYFYLTQRCLHTFSCFILYLYCCCIYMCALEDPLPRKAPCVCTPIKLWFGFWSWSGPVLGLYNDAHNRAIFTIAPMRCAASAPRLPPLRHLTRSMLFWFWFWTEALRHAALLIRESKRGSSGTRFYSARGRWQGSSEILVATWHVRNCSSRRSWQQHILIASEMD